ncbi:MAG: ribose 5-phosphate isomerase B [Candidatus Sumerlaeota bacterium]
MRIAFANDHAALEIRPFVLEYLREAGHDILDFGVTTSDSVDYPDLAEIAVLAVSRGEADLAILGCGTGIGISIAANKIPGIRCALCTDVYSARQARQHNDANAIALRGRNIDPELNVQIVKAFLEAEFSGGRHQRRIDKISKLDQR